MKNKISFLAIFFIFNIANISLFNSAYPEEIINKNSTDIQVVETDRTDKFPDYARMYIGDDKYENFNRKMFNLNMKLNKYVSKPVHILWSSIMPKFGIDRIRDAYNNIEYPKRLASCIIQKDGKGIKQETLRFITNSTIGVGGLFDPADKIFKIKPTNENMEQALCKCKMKSGSYLVMPCLHSCTARSLCGRAIEAALDPSVYLASPITSIIKFGLMLNRTSYMQPLAHLIETTYADPYDIHKKLFGIENYIKNSNFDRQKLIQEEKEFIEEGLPEKAEALIAEENIVKDKFELNKFRNPTVIGHSTGLSANLPKILPLADSIKADIVLDDYKTQTPIVDSMKTAFFEDKSINKSIWNEISIWNHSFRRRLKTDAVIVEGSNIPYKFKYILQKDKTAPLVLLYPSIGEGIENHHSLVFAKMFYDNGYSVVIQGSHFHWEFVKSMPEGFAPGIPNKDAFYIREVSSKILKNLSEKNLYTPEKKIIVGTSFGAVGALFVAEKEAQENILNIDKYIAISPPIELKYALYQVDKNGEEFDKTSTEVKDKTALAAAKILQIYDLKDEKNFKMKELPFSEEEGKMITTFILRQKLSDIIFTLEKVPQNKKTNIYKIINNMSYSDYSEKYLGIRAGSEELNTENDNSLNNLTLYSLENYLTTNNNYKIYESFDDYLINKEQILKLKKIAGENLICLNCGAHLGFLHTKEFLESFKNIIFQ